MGAEVEKYTLRNNVDNMIGSLNQSKQMLDKAETAEEVERVITYIEYILSSFSSEVSKSHDKVKTR